MNVLIINCSPVRDGATAKIVRLAEERLSAEHRTRCICIDDYEFSFCKGCRACHKTARCVQKDDFSKIMEEFLNKMKPLGIVEMCRSGIICIDCAGNIFDAV